MACVERHVHVSCWVGPARHGDAFALVRLQLPWLKQHRGCRGSVISLTHDATAATTLSAFRFGGVSYDLQ